MMTSEPTPDIAAIRKRDQISSNGLESMCERLCTAQDHPDLDCTDAAHPAWWRGHDHTVAVMCREIGEILDGRDSGGGVANEPWGSTRRRLIELRDELATRQRVNMEMVERD